MAYDEKRAGGGGAGFTISLTAVANTVAALALAGICGALWTDHSNLVTLTDRDASRVEDIKRAEERIRDLKVDIEQELRDDRAQRTADTADEKRRIEHNEKRLDDLEFILEPPRGGRGTGSGSGYQDRQPAH